MRSLLDALQAGRLIELPDNQKERALQILANLIEAVPQLGGTADIAGLVLAREKSANTALGMGWACPHARVPGEGELLCAIGWSPGGIDYGAPDGKLVRMVIMFLVPDIQKNSYLKELSALARALRVKAGFQDLENTPSLNEVRNRLLDLVSSAMESAQPDVRARMIQLETRAAATPLVAPVSLDGMAIVPLAIVSGAGLKPVVLTQQRDLVILLESRTDLADLLTRQSCLEFNGWRVLVRGVTSYQAERSLYDCLAVKTHLAPA